MTVPPLQRSPNESSTGPTARARFPWLLDWVLGLLIVVALPLAIISIPNTVSIVSGLLPESFDKLALMRAHGLALPAMILTVPLGAVALRRVKVAHMLVGGLTLLALADVAGGFAGSTFVVAVLRILHGIGAGLLVPATLVAAWGRSPALRGVWTGMLAFSLLGAQALALWPLDNVQDWRVTLQPYPMLTGVALVLAAIYFVLWLVQGQPPTPTPRADERTRLLLASVPAVGIAVVAISTASEAWGAGLVILLAALAIVALLTMASMGGREGRTLSYVMVAIGVVLLPSMAQVTYVEMRGLGGPGMTGLWIPFLVAGLLGVGAAVAARLFAGARWLTPLGLLAMVVGLCSVRVVVPAPDGLVLVIPFALLAMGAAVALTSALGRAGIGAGLYGLALCFPGVLAGYLLATGVQLMMLRGVTVAQQLVDRFVGSLHLWSLIGGFLVVAVILLAALMARRSGPGDGDDGSGPSEPGGPGHGREASLLEDPASGGAGMSAAGGGGRVVGGTGADEPGTDKSGAVVDDDSAGGGGAAGRVSSGWGSRFDDSAGGGAKTARVSASTGSRTSGGGSGGDEGSVPPVPPPAQSPEDSVSP
ncbi:hypothetical protein [Nonomuraea rhizosphaerae]|uniref:hypothetical protein n=1 Tax=Nonomuraea rhizosphaerae TaxID=2665663 RepID=UPI001C5DB025|nr:hypothetical protein [Nonomuraea rhizosphaerae]